MVYIVLNPEERFCHVRAFIMVDFIFELIRQEEKKFPKFLLNLLTKSQFSTSYDLNMLLTYKDWKGYEFFNMLQDTLVSFSGENNKGAYQTAQMYNLLF